jgi:hypothetical protein
MKTGQKSDDLDRRWLAFAAAMVAFNWAGCFSAPAPPVSRQATPAELHQRFPLLQEGRTTQREIRARFGDPSEQHDSGRMLIYLLWFDEQKCLQLQRDKSGSMIEGSPPGNPQAQLVLVFSPEGVLERANLLFRIPRELVPKS